MSNPTEPPARRTLVVGAGPLGQLVAAMLSDRGYPVTLLGRDPMVVDRVNAVGVRVLGDAARSSAGLAATDRLTAGTGRFDLLVLAVGPEHARSALRATIGWLDEAGVVLSLSPGLVDAALSRLASPRRYLGAIATFAATELEPGAVLRGGLGGLLVGAVHEPRESGWAWEPDEAAEAETPGETDEAAQPDEPIDEGDGEPAEQGLAEAAPEAVPPSAPSASHEAPPVGQEPEQADGWVLRALESVASVAVTRDLRAARWSELAIRCAFEPLAAVADLGAAELADQGSARALFLGLLDELHRVACARGVTLADLPGIPMGGLLGNAPHADAPAAAGSSAPSGPPSGRAAYGRHELLHNIAARYGSYRGELGERLRAGLTARGRWRRPPAGEPRQPDAPPCPRLDAALELVDRVAARRARASLATLEALYRHTASAAR